MISASSGQTFRASLIEFTPTSFPEDGDFKGSYVDILRAIERRTGFKFDVGTFPFLRAAERVRSGLADITIGQLTDATSAIGGRSLPIHKYSYYVVTLKPKVFCSVREVRGQIGRLRGGCAGLFPKKTISFFEVTTSYEQGFTMLEKGRLDGFCGIEEGIAYSMKRKNIDTQKFNKVLIGESNRYIHFSPNFDEVAFKRIERAVRELTADGELTKISQKYLDSNGPVHEPLCKSNQVP